jgi:hypothetical protein
LWGKLVEALYLQGVEPSEIAVQVGTKLSTLHTGLTKRGLTKRRKEARAMVKKADLAQLSRATREKLAVATDLVVDNLQEPPKQLERLNLHADTLQKAAKTAALVHGWGEGAAIALVIPGVLTGDDQGEAIDVNASVEPDPASDPEG